MSSVLSSDNNENINNHFKYRCQEHALKKEKCSSVLLMYRLNVPFSIFENVWHWRLEELLVLVYRHCMCTFQNAILYLN